MTDLFPASVAGHDSNRESRPAVGSEQDETDNAARVRALAAELSLLVPAAGTMAMPDSALVAVTAAVEVLGRVTDSLCLSTAAEISHRSRKSLGADRLSARYGCRNEIELIARLTRVAESTAARRVRLGTSLRPRDTLGGELLPAKFAATAEAMNDGELGIDSATAIVDTLRAVEHRADPEHLEAAERCLVGCAVGVNPETGESTVPFTADQTKVQAMQWRVALDPDGVEASEIEAMRGREVVRTGTRDGLVNYRMKLMPEISARLERVFDSLLSPKVTGRFLTEEEERQAAHTRDERTPSQQRHDALASALDVATRSADLPSNGGAPPTVLVTIAAESLVEGPSLGRDTLDGSGSCTGPTATGAGWIDGVDVPISLRAVKQFVCTGGLQRAFFNDEGRLVSLGSPERVFTPQQRRAIAVRDGGCVIPGCNVPAAWCEIHHVIEYARGGPTHTDNGVMLCWYHHRSIDTSGWGVTMRDGVPHVRAPGWIDPRGRWMPATNSRGIRARRSSKPRVT